MNQGAEQGYVPAADGKLATRDNTSLVDNIDIQIIQEARKKNSPYERIGFFVFVYDTILNKLVPRTKSPEVNIEQSLSTQFEVASLIDAYLRLFGRKMELDLPDVFQRLQMAQQKHGSFVPEREISGILDFGEKTASMEADKPQLE